MGYDKEDRRTGFDLFERCREIFGAAGRVAGAENGVPQR